MLFIAVAVFGIGLVGCQKNGTTPTKTSTAGTKALVRTAAGDLLDLSCLKGKSPSQMSSCKVDTGKNAVGGNPQFLYFIWDLIYFHEQQVCQWLYGISSCYQYFGFQGWQGGRQYCDWNWLPTSSFPYSNGLCGGYSDWWRRPDYGDRTCDELRYDRENALNEVNYCNQATDCVEYSNVEYNECNKPGVNKWIATPRLDEATHEYAEQCLTTAGQIYCAFAACLPPTCINNRCSSGCLVY